MICVSKTKTTTASAIIMDEQKWKSFHLTTWLGPISSARRCIIPYHLTWKRSQIDCIRNYETRTVVIAFTFSQVRNLNEHTTKCTYSIPTIYRTFCTNRLDGIRIQFISLSYAFKLSQPHFMNAIFVSYSSAAWLFDDIGVRTLRLCICIAYKITSCQLLSVH